MNAYWNEYLPGLSKWMKQFDLRPDFVFSVDAGVELSECKEWCDENHIQIELYEYIIWAPILKTEAEHVLFKLRFG